LLASSSNTVVEYSPHHSEVEGSSQAAASGTGTEKMAKTVFVVLMCHLCFHQLNQQNLKDIFFYRFHQINEPSKLKSNDSQFCIFTAPLNLKSRFICLPLSLSLFLLES
jgi:hypothetical protein